MMNPTGGCRPARWAMAAAAVLSATAMAVPAAAQDKWPSRRITLVVPFGPGSVTDAMARLIADGLKDPLGQPVIVENRAGAGGILGASNVWKADADGYTLLMGGNTTHSAAPALYKNVPYDPIKDFTPIARLVRFSSVFVTNPQQPFRTVQEFVAFAKANPGKLSCGHGNATGHITCETVKQRLGLDMARVPYTSVPPGMTDLISNNIPLMVPDFLSGVPQVRAGKAIPLAVVMRDRSPLLPDVPTFNETVIKDFEVLPWSGMFGPAGLARETTARLSDEIGKLLGRPEFARRLQDTGGEPFYLAAGPFADYVKADMPVWAGHAKTAGIQPQ